MPPVAKDRMSFADTETASVFVTAAKPTSAEEVSELASRHFGLSGSLERLASERDQNFRMTAQDGSQFILKIANPAEAPAVTDLQTQILLHIAQSVPSLPVQRMVRTTNGACQLRATLSDGTTRTIRLVSCLPGLPLYRAAASVAQRIAIGHSLAELDVALQDFVHAAAKRPLLWNISEAVNVRDRLGYVSDIETRQLAREALERFEQEALPVLVQLPQQVIHCDFNPHNILVDAIDHDRISGILDFGDALMAPRINDVAIAASYHLATERDPLRAAADVVRGYHSRSRIDRPELDILPLLMGARVAMTVAITSWRAELYPDNRDYILRNASSARSGLRALSELSPTQARDILWTACNEV